MGRLVEGQPCADGVQGQNTSGGFQGQGYEAQDDADTRRVEGQCVEDDTREGQENDARPFSERRPYPNTQPATGGAGNGQPPATNLPSSRRASGSQKRAGTPISGGVTAPGARGAYSR